MHHWVWNVFEWISNSVRVLIIVSILSERNPLTRWFGIFFWFLFRKFHKLYETGISVSNLMAFIDGPLIYWIAHCAPAKWTTIFHIVYDAWTSLQLHFRRSSLCLLLPNIICDAVKFLGVRERIVKIKSIRATLNLIRRSGNLNVFLIGE